IPPFVSGTSARVAPSLGQGIVPLSSDDEHQSRRAALSHNDYLLLSCPDGSQSRPPKRRRLTAGLLSRRLHRGSHAAARERCGSWSISSVTGRIASAWFSADV